MPKVPPTPSKSSLSPANPSGEKAITRLRELINPSEMSNEAELLGRRVVLVHPQVVGIRGRIVRVLYADDRKKPLWPERDRRDVFYTVETEDGGRYITGLVWQDFIQIPVPVVVRKSYPSSSAYLP